MLNAFRHHCGQHDTCHAALDALWEVLNAFRHHCGQHAVNSAFTPPLTCAQRLSASLRSTLSGSCASHRPIRVLNAFRHHCGQHAYGIESRSARQPVLNAFRHHCGQHRCSCNIISRNHLYGLLSCTSELLVVIVGKLTTSSESLHAFPGNLWLSSILASCQRSLTRSLPERWASSVVRDSQTGSGP